MGFSTQHPMNVVGRCLLLEKIRFISPTKFVENEKVAKAIPMAVITYDEVTDSATVEVTEINWEYLLFEATMHQLQILFDEFVKKDKEKGEDPKLLKTATPLVGADGQPLTEGNEADEQ